MAVPPVFHLDMVKTLDAQPVDVSLRDKRSGTWVCRFQVWHRRMLPHHRERLLALQHERLRRAAAAAAKRARDRSDDAGGGSEEDEDGAHGMHMRMHASFGSSDLSSGGAAAMEWGDYMSHAAHVVAHAIQVDSSDEDEDYEQLLLVIRRSSGGGGGA